MSDVSMSPIGHPFNCQARLWLRWKLRPTESHTQSGAQHQPSVVTCSVAMGAKHLHC